MSKSLRQRMKLIRCDDPRYWQLRLGSLWITHFLTGGSVTVWLGQRRLWHRAGRKAA